MNIKNNINLAIIMIITLLFISVGFSFAYFTANLSGGEDSTTITVTGGSMNIYYNSGSNINITNIIPSNDAAAIKTFTVTGNNTTGLNMGYKISLVVEENTFSEAALKYVLSSANPGSNGTTVPNIETQTNIGIGAKNILLGQGNFTGPTDGDKAHNYTLSIYFPNQEYSQNIDQDKIFRGYILTENSDNDSTEIPAYYTMATDEDFTLISDVWLEEHYDEDLGDTVDIYIDVNLYTGDDEYVIIPETINGTTFNSVAYMFGTVWLYDEATDEEYSINSSSVKGVASLNLNITDMRRMFYESDTDTLEIKNLNTSNVTNMSYMFADTQFTSLDLNDFDTSNTTDMSFVFKGTNLTSLDITSFDTSKVFNMSYMFAETQFTSLDLSNFDTSAAMVTAYMFAETQIENLDLSNFDTSKVIAMLGMFYGSNASTIDMSSFDTSNVISMSSMFSHSKVTSLDFSNFNTSNVTNMSNMFFHSNVNSLDLSGFDTSKVTSMHQMFSYCQITDLDISSFDMSNVTNTTNMFRFSLVTTGYARTQADADILNSSYGIPETLHFTVE